MCVNPSGTYGYNNQSKTWVDVSAAPSGTASGGALSCFPYNQLDNQAHLCVTPSGTYSSGSSAFLSSTAVTKQCTGGSTYTQPTCAYNPAMSTYVTNVTSCTTTSTYATSCTNYAYLPASGSWSYVTGAPPGTADGSPVSCVQSTPNINVNPSYSYFYVCVTPSGTYGFPDGTDSWSYYGAAPPGA